ncbi:MAG: hypothetical protein JW940_11800 [Polyangiaceae bacterium]|nr:hypothetical protein [Polyangiaceae bacterium]
MDARPASGQTLTPITAKNVKRSRKAANEGRPWAINYQDCVDNVKFTFSIAFSGVMTDLSFAVWTGSAGSGYDCSQPSQRTVAGSDCRTLYEPGEINRKIELTAQELVSNNGVDGCEEDITGRNVNLYFALVDSDGNPPGGATASSSCSGWCSKWDEIEIDLSGPSKPSNVSAGVGENMLLVNWDVAANKDINGYRLYCDPAPRGAGTSTTTSYRPLADDDDDLVDQGDAGLVGQDDAGLTDGQGQAGSTSTGGTQGGAAGTGQTGTADIGAVDQQGTAGTGTAARPCGSGVLVPGQRPDESYRCGSVEGATASRANAKGLSNGIEYAVAVAAVDTVGNVGELSNVACGTPHQLDDFFEVYRREGGNGGGGYCATTGRGRSGTLALAMGALLVAGALRQRRGRSS